MPFEKKQSLLFSVFLKLEELKITILKPRDHRQTIKIRRITTREPIWYCY